ncbi:hypothetical protein Bbelb_278260 [Branchiostoma belcheri]|nr:hypothetical protein Bbelb_278260 [Branchiostoma belcheri]
MKCIFKSQAVFLQKMHFSLDFLWYTGSERQPQCSHRASAVQEVLQKRVNSGPAIAPWLLLQLVRRQLAAAADGKTITCKTGGLPITLLQVSKARKPTGEASIKTGQRRTGEVKAVREIVSGGDTDGQMGIEMKSLGREALQNILRQMDLSAIQIPTGYLISAQLDIGINYNQCRKLRRFVQLYNKRTGVSPGIFRGVVLEFSRRRAKRGCEGGRGPERGGIPPSP